MFKFSTPNEVIKNPDEHVMPQNPPIAGEEVVLKFVIEDLKKRALMGKRKYHRYLETFNGRNALIDAYQEALDLVMYLKQQLLEMEKKEKDE